AKLQGAAFCQTTSAIWGGEGVEYVYPVAVGAAAARLEIDATLTATLYLHAMISNLVAASQRLMSLGQTNGQAIVSGLASLCEKVAHETATETLDDLHSTAFLSDIASMRHETQQPRIFRS
ncbi:MAG: urease accessory UreF family protein, partial [Paracoccaceae bacterium]